MPGLAEVTLTASTEVSRWMAQGLRENPESLKNVSREFILKVWKHANQSPPLWITCGTTCVLAVVAKYCFKDSLQQDVKEANDTGKKVTCEIKGIRADLQGIKLEREGEIETIGRIAQALIEQNSDLQRLRDGQLVSNSELHGLIESMTKHLGFYEKRVVELIDLSGKQSELAKGLAAFIESQNQEGRAINEETKERLKMVNMIYEMIVTLLPPSTVGQSV